MLVRQPIEHPVRLMPGCYHPREPQLRQMLRRSGWRLANHIGQRASRPAARRRRRLLCAADLELPLALLWAETPEGQPFSPAMLRAAQQWVNLGLIRGIGDLSCSCFCCSCCLSWPATFTYRTKQSCRLVRQNGAGKSASGQVAGDNDPDTTRASSLRPWSLS